MIYLRITVDGRRVEMSTHRKTYPYKWNAAQSMLQGFSPDIGQLNVYLAKIRTDIYKHAEKLKEADFPLTAESLRDAYLGKGQKYKMLLEVFQEHNNQVNSLVGQDFAEGTTERYRTARSHLAEYIQFEYKRKDVPLKRLSV